MSHNVLITDQKRGDIYEQLGYWQPLTIGDHLESWAEGFGERVALAENDRRMTYLELCRKVNRMAGYLSHLGVKKGDHVVVQLPNSIAFALINFALFKIGALPIQTMPGHRESELEGIFALTKPVAYVFAEIFLGFDYAQMSQRLARKTPSLINVITEEMIWEVVESPAQLSTYQSSDPPTYRDIALLLLSGGTTETPKLIPRTHTDYMYNAKASAQRCRLTGDSVFLAVLPIAHNFPLACPGMLGTLSVGGKVIFSRTTSFDEAFPLIEKEQVTITALVPAVANIWLQALEWDNSDLSSLKMIQVGGSPLDDNLAKRIMSEFGCRLQQVFGMAEGLLCYTSPDDPDDIILSCQGKPLSAQDEVRVVDDEGNDVPAGELGELLVRGPYTIAGYYRLPEQNLKDFTDDGYYRSGDKVRFTSEGNIQVMGRIKDQINRAGEKIMASEIESYLNTHPDIKEAMLVGLPDKDLGERNCAYVISSNPSLSLSDIHQFLNGLGVARYKMPDQLAFIDSWPLTSIGKVNKKQLIAKAQSDEEPTKDPVKKRFYYESAMPFDDDPLFSACQIIEAGRFDDFHLYENIDEWSLGLGIYALLSVNARQTDLSFEEETYQFPNNDLASTIQEALSKVPIEDYRAYGTANFELACYLHQLDAVQTEEVFMKLFVPQAEVRFTGDSVVIRAIEKDSLNRLTGLVSSILNKNQEPGIKSDIRERVTRKKLQIPEISTHDSDIYQKIVASAIEEIREPQYRKVILSRKIPLTQEIDMVASYIAGRQANTPARSFLLKIGDFKAAGFSPETLLEIDNNGNVSTQPLAGTRSTGSNMEEEEKLREELISDSKEIAEHAISIKLAQEEMLSVCEARSITVSDFMSVARRGTVQHLASRLKGKIKQECNSWHAFNALFPAVTASGIPKKEAIDSIVRFESCPRNLYSGCVIIYDSTGAIDAALVLRSFFQKEKQTWLQAGAGIIDMSVPERELEETQEKLQSVSKQLIST